MRTKFIFITGGVLSSLGKGLASAAIGALLECRGLRVTFQKLDPYINVDPGTMNPLQHGEVFVTEDGAETDMDLGHYERFTNTAMGKENNFTSGQVYETVIKKERRGDYLGKTIQVIPHITDEIKARILSLEGTADIAIIEIGGTVGDIEGQPFLEAIRQLRGDLGSKNVCYIHLTLVPYLRASGELKTKPTQHSVRMLREIGIQPQILLCRTERFLTKNLKSKIALFCNVDKDAVITAIDVESIYEVPLVFHQEGLDDKIIEYLNIWTGAPNLERWEEINRRIRNPKDEVVVGMVGKYVELAESYKSLNESLAHAGIANECRVTIRFIDSEQLEQKGNGHLLGGLDCILVPGGFGDRGIEGKVYAASYARKNKIPYLGICLGMQTAIISFARAVCGLDKANSAEFDEDSPHPVVDLMPEQKNITDKGATMRLGAYPCNLKEGTLIHKIYGCTEISERHRHRYEVNNDYREKITEHGMILSGLSPSGNLVETIELKDHPWFVGCQFHPEFKSSPMNAHPLFREFIRASIEYTIGGEAEESSDGMSSVSENLPLSMFIILLLLIGQFNSVRKSVIVLATIPLGLIGVVIGLLITKSTFGFMAFLGIISLSGIIINNAIVLLDRIKIELEKFNKSPQNAIIDAAKQRFRPIMLTTFTTSLGLIPLWIGGGAMWEPMAIGILFGLLFATVITLLFVPVLYRIFFRVSFKKFN